MRIALAILAMCLLMPLALQAAPLAQQQESSISGFVNPNDGSRLSQGTVEYFTNSGLTTPIDVWSDSGKLNVLSQPVDLNDAGIATDGANPVTVFADGTLWMRLKDEDGVTVYTGLALSYNSVVDFGGLYIDIASTYGTNTAALNSAFADFEGGDDVTFLFNSDNYTYTDTKSLASNIKFLMINGATIDFSETFTYNHEEIEIKDISQLKGSGVFMFVNDFIRANNNTQIIGDSLDINGTLANSELYPEWFGVVSTKYEDTNIDTTAALQKTFAFANQGAFNWQPIVVFTGANGPEYYCTDEIISTSSITKALYIRGLEPRGKNREHKSAIQIKMSTADDSKYIFNVNKDSFEDDAVFSIKDIAFEVSEGGGILRTNGSVSRLTIENVYAYGMHIVNNWPTLYDNDLVQTYDDQRLFYIDGVFGGTIKNVTVQGGFIAFYLDNTDDMYMENCRIDSVTAIVRDSTSATLQNGQQLNIKGLETEGGILGYVVNKYGLINIDGWHMERGSSIPDQIRDLSTDGINAVVVSYNSVITFSEDMTNKLIPQVSVIKIVDDNDPTYNYGYYFVDEVNGTQVSVFANGSYTEDEYDSDIYWDSSSNTVTRINGYAGGTIQKYGSDATPIINVKNFYGSMDTSEAINIFYMSGSIYSTSVFENCILNKPSAAIEQGVRNISNRFYANNNAQQSDRTMGGLVFNNCSQLFTPVHGQPQVYITPYDISLGKPPHDKGRGTYFTPPSSHKQIDRKHYFSLTDLSYRDNSSDAYRQPIIEVDGEEGTYQKFYAAVDDNMYMADKTLPNHDCYLKIRVLAFTKSGTESINLRAVGTVGTGTLSSIEISSNVLVKEVIIRNPSAMIGRVQSDASYFQFSSDSGNPFLYSYCSIEEITMPHTSGVGTPEGLIYAPVGTIYSRSDGGANTSIYVKESGTGNTGWVGK